MAADAYDRLLQDWPAPVEVLNETGASDIVLLCEHASRHMPAEFGHLGLEPVDRERHIAWDIGAAEVTRRLSVALDAPAFLGGYSRLLIDLNRPLDSGSSIPARSESTDIPGNIELSPQERARRAALIFHPFHDRVRDHIAAREAAGRPVRIVAMHSFTPVFFGTARPWHAGILYDRSQLFAEAVMAGLRTDPALTIGANVPYIISRDEDYAIPVHGQDRGHEAILIEVRQDLLSSVDGIEQWADRLAIALASSLQAEAS